MSSIANFITNNLPVSASVASTASAPQGGGAADWVSQTAQSALQSVGKAFSWVGSNGKALLTNKYTWMVVGAGVAIYLIASWFFGGDGTPPPQGSGGPSPQGSGGSGRSPAQSPMPRRESPFESLGEGEDQHVDPVSHSRRVVPQDPRAVDRAAGMRRGYRRGQINQGRIPGQGPQVGLNEHGAQRRADAVDALRGVAGGQNGDPEARRMSPAAEDIYG